MTREVVVVRQTWSRRTVISKEEVRASLSPGDREAERRYVDVPTEQFAEAVEQGDWEGHDRFLREKAAEIQAACETAEDVSIHYFGMAEVPHLVALGAHAGDERTIQLHDHDRETGSWSWSEKGQRLELDTTGVENLQGSVSVPGVAVLRVAVSYPIEDHDVLEVVGPNTLADVRVSRKGDCAQVGAVRSEEDLEAVRREVRAALALLKQARPNLTEIHLFVAGPPSVCFVVGQELCLRNSPPVQTYRYRSEATPRQQRAIYLVGSAGDEVRMQLTGEQREAAKRIRTAIWPAVLKDVAAYAAAKEEDGQGEHLWFEHLEPRDALRSARPFPCLPPVYKVIEPGIEVDPEPFVDEDNEYRLNADSKKWQLSDELLVGLWRAAGEDEERMREVIRLFLFHECLHLYHSITKRTAREVGKFANCLEYLDYTADTYALLHQLDYERVRGDRDRVTGEKARELLVEQVELAVLSFWAFDGGASRLQLRRLRRYLNWYWRYVQLKNAKDLETVMLLFNRQPRIELGGLGQFARGRRVFVRFDELDPTTYLELALVREDERLFRLTSGPNANLEELLAAFQEGKHEEIVRFFGTLFEMVESGQLPVVDKKE